jgi:hypothetical protein
MHKSRLATSVGIAIFGLVSAVHASAGSPRKRTQVLSRVNPVHPGR